MDAYDPATVFSSIDQYGRYAYANQPPIAQWNLARLAETLLAFLHADRDEAIRIATERIEGFPAIYTRHWLDGFRRKIGLVRRRWRPRPDPGAARRDAAGAGGLHDDLPYTEQWRRAGGPRRLDAAWRERLARDPQSRRSGRP